MPEGDTIHQARLRVAPVLEGHRVELFWARKIRGYRPRSGQLIEELRVHGKHLLIDFDRRLSLRVHLGMGGYWRTSTTRAAEGARRDPKLRLEIQTEAGVARCYSAPVVETFVRDEDMSPLVNLGPDLAVGPDDRPAIVDVAVRRARLRSRSGELMADVVLDQEIAAGIGNVYKSEVLFICGVHPLTPLELVSDEQLVEVYATASELLHLHSQPGNAYRVTTAARPQLSTSTGTQPARRPLGRLPRHFVYERWRAPCLRCLTPVRRTYEGRLGRSSYWCPTCQPELDGPR